MGILNRIIDIGTQYEADPLLKKHIRFTNSVSLIVFSFAIENTLLSIFCHEPFISAVFALHGMLILCMLYFNSRSRRILASAWFSTIAITFVTFYSIAFTAEGLNYVFLPMIIFLQFFLFPMRDKKYVIVFVSLCTLAFFAVVISYSLDVDLPFVVSPEFIKMQRLNSFMGMPALSIAFGLYAYSTINNAEQEAAREKEKTEGLLLNILPSSIAQRFKYDQSFLAEGFDSVTVLFADIVGFSTFSEKVSPAELVSFLNTVFSRFDVLTEAYGLEKIKTIGDAYMVAGGLPVPVDAHARKMCGMALDMMHAVRDIRTPGGAPLRLRIGISTGPVSAGVIGVKKFIYDLWGDTVNIASRMQTHAENGYIQMTDHVYELIKDSFECTPRGTVQVKSKGEMMTYYLIARKDNNDPPVDADQQNHSA